jgi:hypothetical protein
LWQVFLAMKRILGAAAAAILVSFLAVVPALADSVVESWTESSPDSVVSPSTMDSTPVVTYPARALGIPVNRFVSTDPDASIRGRGSDGRWTEWRDLPAVLAVPVSLVQVRTVRSAPVSVRASMVPSRLAARDATALSYRIFATREGLVGGHTASGHVIVDRDHFVALPSRRGLSRAGAGDYTVKVCTESGARCEWAPVWDVGPWNTRDDYWNAPDKRQMWRDLPRGTPQSQAAEQDGYNGGLDQFGRVVRNPAGIDLADGTFWDGLSLTGNSWVRATYTWTASGPFGTVAAGEPLNVRSAPGTDAPIVGAAADHARVPIECATTAERVTSPLGTTSLWYRLAPDMWSTAAYHTPTPVPHVPTC